MWWVYVLQSQQVRFGRRGNPLPGFFYVGMTTDPARRLRQHNGEIKGGGRWTARHRPHVLKAIYGPYADRSEALKAEHALKRGKRGEGRCRWTPGDSPWCRGEGPLHPWVTDGVWVTPDPETHVYPPEPVSNTPAPSRPWRRKRRRRRGKT